MCGRTAERRRALAGVAGWRCHYCGNELDDETATLDHIVPRALGGPTLPLNLALACRRCNSGFGDAVVKCLCARCAFARSHVARHHSSRRRVLEVADRWIAAGLHPLAIA